MWSTLVEPRTATEGGGGGGGGGGITERWDGRRWTGERREKGESVTESEDE